MKYLLQFLIIMGITFVGEVLHYFIPLPIPSSIYGIVLLFVALEMRWIEVKHIRETSSLLIAIMPALFIPSAVGLLEAWDVIRPYILQYAIITFVSTFVVMGVAGLVTQYVIKKQHVMKTDRLHRKKGEDVR